MCMVLVAIDSFFTLVSSNRVIYVQTVSVAFKLSKRKPDDNLHMLHSLLFGKKTKVMLLTYCLFFMTSISGHVKDLFHLFKGTIIL